METVNLPTPENPGRAPVWENYIVAQLVQASLGHIPEHALAMGVEVAGNRVLLRFQLGEVTEDDQSDIDDIVSSLEALVGNGVQVDTVHEVRGRREISPFDGVRWVFLARI